MQEIERCRFNPWVRNPLEDKNGNSLQYPSLGNPMDRRAWQATVHGAAESDMTEYACVHECNTFTFYGAIMTSREGLSLKLFNDGSIEGNQIKHRRWPIQHLRGKSMRTFYPIIFIKSPCQTSLVFMIQTFESIILFSGYI